MLTYFNKNKLRYEKGQLAPFFILIMVVLVIMAMVTLNLSKVAFIKADSANAVDAGALASGSVMANVFNAVAGANHQMWVYYVSFYASISISFVIALYSLYSAYGLACSNPCAALAPLEKFIWASRAISAAIFAYSIGQLYFYKSIRKMAQKGREKGVEIGHKFSFMNSGINSKLKSGKPPDDITECGCCAAFPNAGCCATCEEKKHNYREEYSDFLDGINNAEEYTYKWKDGQDREHYVKSRVVIKPVDTFDLRVMAMPSPAITAALAAVAVLAYLAKQAVTRACSCLAGGNPAWIAACIALHCAVATSLMTAIFPIMAAVWVGLLPGLTIKDSTGTVLMWNICWIDDIDHDRKVFAATKQHHQGADLGLWKTRYPDRESNSTADFTGQGSIYPWVLRHDPSIIAVDTGLPPGDTCRKIIDAVEKLKEEIKSLHEQADSLIEQAIALEEKAEYLESIGQTKKAEKLRAQAKKLREAAAKLVDDADSKQLQICQYVANNPDCLNKDDYPECS